MPDIIPLIQPVKDASDGATGRPSRCHGARLVRGAARGGARVCEPDNWPGGIQESNGSAVQLTDVVRWLRMRAEAETTTGARLTLMAAAQALEEAR